MEKYMLPCLTKRYFGFDCPGCGGQRAVLLLIKGEFKEAFVMYPAIYPLSILALLMLVNIFFPVKNYDKLVSFFAIFSITTVLLSYALKMFLLYYR